MESKISLIVITLSIFVFGIIAVVEMPNIFENVLAQEPEGSQQQEPESSQQDRSFSSSQERTSEEFRTQGNLEGSSETLDRIPDTEHRTNENMIPDREGRSSEDTIPDGNPRSNG